MDQAILEPHPSLLARWAELKNSEPRVKIREAASRLGTSEATLLSLMLGQGVRRLRCEPGALLSRLEPLGRLMALTRNDAVVHERHGVYANVQVTGNVGLVANPDIDLRLDFSVWKAAFAEEKVHAGKVLRSVQFFDAQGVAVHKVFLEDADETRARVWEDLVAEFLEGDQATFVAAPRVEKPRAEPLLEGFVDAWGQLKDPHHFHSLLKRHRMTREQGLKAAEGTFTRPVAPSSVEALLNQASESGVPIMVFVANRGCVQIHTGLVVHVKPLGTWRNVLDPDFNLHVDLEGLTQGWVVQKPSEAGTVTSVEYLGVGGELAVQFFGKRKPGEVERMDWRLLTESL